MLIPLAIISAETLVMKTIYGDYLALKIQNQMDIYFLTRKTIYQMYYPH